jgi:hypothetical protein
MTLSWQKFDPFLIPFGATTGGLTRPGQATLLPGDAMQSDEDFQIVFGDEGFSNDTAFSVPIRSFEAQQRANACAAQVARTPPLHAPLA